MIWKSILENKETRQKAEFIMSIIRTLAAITAATFLVITNWR